MQKYSANRPQRGPYSNGAERCELLSEAVKAHQLRTVITASSGRAGIWTNETGLKQRRRTQKLSAACLCSGKYKLLEELSHS